MKEVSFIHVSDIHLGHQQFNLEERFSDFGKAFAEVVNYALLHKVNFIIIGGDFFHKRAINAETLKLALELLQPLKDADIPIVAIEGNHDKAFYQDKSSWIKLLNSLGYIKLLKPVFVDGKIALTQWITDGDGCLTELYGIRLIGLGYLGATTEQRLSEIADLIEPSDNFTVMILHAAVNKLLAQDLGGVKKEVLEKFRDKIDYLALGHIHAKDEDGWYFNPGSLENCHIDEAKAGREKGFYHVIVQGKDKNVQYIPSHPRTVKLINIDITGAENPEEVYQRVWQSLDQENLANFEKPMIQLILKGEIDFSALAIETGTLTRDIREKYICLYVEVQNNANLPQNEGDTPGSEVIDRNAIEKQVLSQIVTQQYPQYKEFDQELVNLIIRVKEAALAGEEASEIINEVAALAEFLPSKETENITDEVAAGGETFEDQES